MADTKIEWATKVWNPTTGCTKVSQGCKFCYAERIYERFHPGQSFSKVQMIPGRLEDPIKWHKPQRVFVDSMSDLFHPDVQTPFIFDVFKRMMMTGWHTYIVLTKRPERMQRFCQAYFERPLPNVWLGVSIEDQKTADERIPLLLQTPAAATIVSYEPALGAIDLEQFLQFPPLTEGYKMTFGNEEWMGLDWVIMGCESGHGRRPMSLDWARSMRDQCQLAEIPFFLKQADIDGALIKLPELDGKVWAEYPEERK